MPPIRRIAQAAIPAATLACVALGLRLGARTAVRAAIVHGAPPAPSGLAWQLTTLREARGIREAVGIRELEVVARKSGDAGHPPAEARWRGASNEEGVAEAWIALADVHDGDALILDVRDAASDETLARGTVQWRATSWAKAADATTTARPTKRSGALRLDVAVYGERLAPGFASPVWVRATRGADVPAANVVIRGEAEPGLELARAEAITCAAGWARFDAKAVGHVAGVRFSGVASAVEAASARGTSGEAPGEASGEWYGALPVAPGGAYVDLSLREPAGAPIRLALFAPSASRHTYVEVASAKARIWAAALDLTRGPTGDAEARFEVPPLPPGKYTLVTSGDARGADTASPSTLARTFETAGDAEAPRVADRCADDAALATTSFGRLERWVALDGIAGAEAAFAEKQQRGLLVAFGALVVGGLAEALLFLGGVLANRTALDRAMAEAEHEASERVGERLENGHPRAHPSFVDPHAGLAAVALGLALALLGFGLLAAALLHEAP